MSYGCGLRAGEVVRLKVKHIDSAQKIIRIEQSKGRKDRNVMLSPETLGSVAAMVEGAPGYDATTPLPERWLFPGRKPAGRPMTTRQLSRLFHEAAEAAGIKKCVTLHALRHSFATHLLDRGTDIRKIQALLGHDKLDTTARYTRVATGMIADIESPLDLLAEPTRSPASTGKTSRRRNRPAAMSRPALEVADIFRDHGAAWRSANAGHVSLDQLKVMSAIERCRTAAAAEAGSPLTTEKTRSAERGELLPGWRAAGHQTSWSSKVHPSAAELTQAGRDPLAAKLVGPLIRGVVLGVEHLQADIELRHHCVRVPTSKKL